MQLARLAKPNHKYGPYKKPDQVFTINPYKTGQKIPGSYSSTSTILNLDTASLELQSASGYYANIVKNMKIKGKTSGAIAKVTNVRLVTDNAGTLIGSLFLPDPKQTSKPSFETGTKTFTLTTSKENSTISGATDSTAESTFTASGTLQNIEETTLRIRNAQVDRLIKTDERTKKEKSTKTKHRPNLKIEPSNKQDGLTHLHNRLRFQMKEVYSSPRLKSTLEPRINRDFLLLDRSEPCKLVYQPQKSFHSVK